MDNSLSVGPGAARHGVVLIAVTIMPIMAIISLIPVVPLLMQQFAATPGSDYLVPFALTVPALCVALFAPLAGWLSDRIGAKRLLITALCLYAVTGVLPWFLTDIYPLIAARIALGIMEAAIVTVSTALFGDYFEEPRRQRWIAMQVGVSSIASIFMIAIGGMLGEMLGARGPFLLYLLALPIALVAGVVLFQPKRHLQAAIGAAVRFPFAQILPLLVITLGVGVAFYTMLVQLGPILMLSGDASPGMIGAAGAATSIGVGAGSILFRQMGRQVGAKALAIGLVIVAIGYLGTGLATSFNGIAAFAVIACIGGGLLLPNMITWTMQHLPAEVRGRGVGLWTSAFFIGQFAAPLVATALAGPAGGLGGALQVYAVVAAIGAVAALFTSFAKPARQVSP